MSPSPPTAAEPALDAPLAGASLTEDVRHALLAFGEHLAFERRLALGTARAYLSDLRLVFEAAGGRRPLGLHAIGVAELNQAIASLKTPRGRALHPRTIGRKHSALRTFYDWAIAAHDPTLADPSPWLISPPQPRKAPKPLQVPSALAIVQGEREADGDDTRSALDGPAPSVATTPFQQALQLRDVAALLLMYGPGLRRQEVLDLELADVDLGSRWLRVRGRGRKTREVPIPEGCIEGLRAYWAWRATAAPGNPYVLPGRGLRPLAARTLALLVGRAARRMLGHHASPKQLRHSFATHLMAHGARLSHIRQMLGHSTVAATERYREVAFGELSEVMGRCHPRGRAAGGDAPEIEADDPPN